MDTYRCHLSCLLAIVGSLSSGFAVAGDTRAAAEREYEALFVGFEEDLGQSVTTAEDFRAYQGKQLKPLEGARFYEAVGRPEFARQFRENDTRRALIRVAGFAGIAAGVAIPFLNALRTPAECPGPECTTARATNIAHGVLVGAAVAGGGGLIVLWTSYMNPQPIPPSKARELAEEHNALLKQRLHLSTGEPAAPSVRVSVGFMPRLDGGVLGAQLGF